MTELCLFFLNAVSVLIKYNAFTDNLYSIFYIYSLHRRCHKENCRVSNIFFLIFKILYSYYKIMMARKLQFLRNISVIGWICGTCFPVTHLMWLFPFWFTYVCDVIHCNRGSLVYTLRILICYSPVGEL